MNRLEREQMKVFTPLRMFVILLGTAATALPAQAQPKKHVQWREVPITVELGVDQERSVHFPGPVTVGLPASLNNALRVQIVSGTIYLKPYQAFVPTRVVVRDIEDGATYLLDVEADPDTLPLGPMRIHASSPDGNPKEMASDEIRRRQSPDYVALTRFAAQQLYAPARLVPSLQSVRPFPIATDPVPLMIDGRIEATPVTGWRAGDRYVTAVQLTNTSLEPMTLDPRRVRGRWLTATFQHSRLGAAGSRDASTVLYLVSAQPFAQSR